MSPGDVEEYLESEGITYVRRYGENFIAAIVRGKRTYRSKSMPTLDEAVRFVKAQAEEAGEDPDVGKKKLADLCHRGELTKDDVEWAIGRFDGRGVFRK